MSKSPNFDAFAQVVLVDAGQIHTAAALQAVTLGCKKLTLFGDHKQLPPYVTSTDEQVGSLVLLHPLERRTLVDRNQSLCSFDWIGLEIVQ